MKKFNFNKVGSAQETAPKMNVSGTSNKSNTPKLNLKEIAEEANRPHELSDGERQAKALVEKAEREMLLKSLRSDFNFVGTAARKLVEENVPPEDIEAVINCFREVAIDGKCYYIDGKGVALLAPVPPKFRATVSKLCMLYTLDGYTKSSTEVICKVPHNTLWVQTQHMFNMIIRLINK